MFCVFFLLHIHHSETSQIIRPVKRHSQAKQSHNSSIVHSFLTLNHPPSSFLFILLSQLHALSLHILMPLRLLNLPLDMSKPSQSGFTSVKIRVHEWTKTSESRMADEREVEGSGVTSKGPFVFFRQSRSSSAEELGPNSSRKRPMQTIASSHSFMSQLVNEFRGGFLFTPVIFNVSC